MMPILAFEQNHLVPVAKTVITEPVELIYHIKYGHEIAKKIPLTRLARKKKTKKPRYFPQAI